MEAQALVEPLRADGDGLTRVGGVPAEAVQAVAAQEEVLAVAEVDGVGGGGHGEGGKTDRQDEQSQEQGGRAGWELHSGILLWGYFVVDIVSFLFRVVNTFDEYPWILCGRFQGTASQIICRISG